MDDVELSWFGPAHADRPELSQRCTIENHDSHRTAVHHIEKALLRVR
jgi:hypothetical protein